ncbi:MAG TPA: tripartite tricarboxylate transporter TctB family protein [Alphaproteobacteria bacterium]|nr:tripartite tricarboxylate transporter TctB family protein [Alphaproteobacteria bacterium]
MDWRGGGRLTRDRLAGAALIALAGAMAWEATRLPVGSLASPGPGYWPLMLAIALGGFAALVSLSPGGPTVERIGWKETPRAGVILAACAFAALAIERLGFRLTVFVVLVVLLGIVERRRPAAAIAVALAIALGSFFLFADLLRVPLPRGPAGI